MASARDTPGFGSRPANATIAAIERDERHDAR